MIDGITINTSIANKEEWSILTGVDLSAPTYISTGEIKVKKRGNVTVAEYRGKWEGFFIEVREVSAGFGLSIISTLGAPFTRIILKVKIGNPLILVTCSIRLDISVNLYLLSQKVPVFRV